MDGLKIDPEFAALIPPLTAEELAALEQNVLRDGVRDSLIAWDEKNILLDGHNRRVLAQRHSLAYRVKRLKFESRDEAKAWMVGNQLGRRNLTPDQASYLRGVEYRLTKKGVGEHGSTKRDQNDPFPEKTADVLAKKHGVSAPTIKRDAEFADAVDKLEEIAPGIREKVMRGEGPPRRVIVEASKLDTARAIKAIDTTPHVARNSGNSEWYTPNSILERARAVLNAIDLDPASSATANAVVRAKNFYTAEDDGLAQRWRGKVWLNPPYAAALVRLFCEKLIAHVANGDVPEAIVLVNNATETRWFQSLCGSAKIICLPAGRIKYWSPDKDKAAPLQGQALLYFGDNGKKFISTFCDVGLIADVVH